MPNQFFSLLALASLFLVQPGWSNPPGEQRYQLARVIEVAGRQGIATDGKRYFVSGSKTLHIYTKDGKLLKSNEDPFAGLAKPANHFGDNLPFAGKYLDDLFVGDLLYDLMFDPSLLASADEEVALSPEELDALIEESRKETREAIKGMGLDEETSKRILDNMEGRPDGNNACPGRR